MSAFEIIAAAIIQGIEAEERTRAECTKPSDDSEDAEPVIGSVIVSESQDEVIVKIGHRMRKILMKGELSPFALADLTAEDTTGEVAFLIAITYLRLFIEIERRRSLALQIQREAEAARKREAEKRYQYRLVKNPRTPGTWVVMDWMMMPGKGIVVGALVPKPTATGTMVFVPVYDNVKWAGPLAALKGVTMDPTQPMDAQIAAAQRKVQMAAEQAEERAQGRRKAAVAAAALQAAPPTPVVEQPPPMKARGVEGPTAPPVRKKYRGQER